MTLAAINAQIRASRERLRELLAKRAAIVGPKREQMKARNKEILSWFDDYGLDASVIARRMKLPQSLVRQFLYSRGRTKRDRAIRRSELAIMAETQR